MSLTYEALRESLEHSASNMLTLDVTEVQFSGGPDHEVALHSPHTFPISSSLQSHTPSSSLVKLKLSTESRSSYGPIPTLRNPGTWWLRRITTPGDNCISLNARLPLAYVPLAFFVPLSQYSVVWKWKGRINFWIPSPSALVFIITGFSTTDLLVFCASACAPAGSLLLTSRVTPRGVGWWAVRGNTLFNPFWAFVLMVQPVL